MSGNSWVTLATNDTYSLGALVLARSLRRVGTNHNLTVMITPGVSAAMRIQLASVFNVIEEVNILDSKDEKNLALLTRPELGITFTKLHCWKLTRFSKCVFLDADVLVLQNCDELFDREELSAAPDVGWPDCFNSGVFVYRPSIETYNALINFALSQGSFDGGDQGLLNQFFSDWATKDISRHLPFIYNMCSSATYSYLPAFKQYGQNVKIVHFIGTSKPWLQYLDSETRQVRSSPGSEHLQGLLQLWWDIFCNDVHSALSSEMVHRSSQVSQLENSPMSHFIREICLNLEPKISLNESKPPTSIYEHDPSDGYWDPWEMYQEPQYTIQSVNSEKHSTSNTHFHRDSVSQGHNHDNSNTPLCNSLTQSSFFSQQSVYMNDGYHEQQYNQKEHQYSLPPLNTNLHSSQTTTNSSQHSEGHVFRNVQDLKETSVSIHCVTYTGCEHEEEHLHDDNCVHQNIRDIGHGHTCNYEDDTCTSVDMYMPNVIQHKHSEGISGDIHAHNKSFSSEESPTSDMQPKPIASASYKHASTVISHPALLPENKTLLSPDNHIITTFYDTECLSSPATTELETEDAGLAGALSQLTLGVARSPEQIALEEHLRKQAWEHGNIDYMNRDSFDNIWRKICETLAEAPSADPLPEQREPSPQVSSVVVESISTEVKPADDASLSKSQSISVSSAHKENTTALLSSQSESKSNTSDVSTDLISVPSLENSSSEVQVDVGSRPTDANDISISVATSDLSTPEYQDSFLNQKLVIQQEGTISSSAIEIHTESSPDVVQTVNLQDTQLQLHSTNQDVKIEEKDENKEKQVPIPSQDLSKPSGTVGVLDSDATTENILDITPKQVSDASEGSREPEVTSIPHTKEETTVASIDSLLVSDILESQSKTEGHTTEIPANPDVPLTDLSVKVSSVTDPKSTTDLVNEPVSCATTSTTASTLDSVIVTNKVSVTAPTPPTSPTDNLTSAPSVPAATATLSVEPSVLPTPPVGSEFPDVEAVPKSEPVSATTVGSEHLSTKVTQTPASPDSSVSPSTDAASLNTDPTSVSPDTSVSTKTVAAQVPDPVSCSPTPVSSPSESHGTSESTSQATDTKAPIPPKRRHKPSQNPDQSGSKSGKPSTKSPKGKK